MLITAASLDALRTGFRKEYNTGFASYGPMWNKVATKVPSSTKSNTYGWLRDFPRLREWIGDRQVKSLAEGSYAIENKPFEATVGVKRTDIEDDNLGIYAPMMQGLGQSASEFPDELIFTLLGAGFDTPCWDGQNFFDAEHPVMDDAGSVYSNMQDGASAAWFLLDTRKPLKPLINQVRQEARFVSMTQPEDEQVFMKNEYRYGVDLRGNAGFGFPQMAFASKAALTADNYAANRQAMTSQVSETGHKLNIKPDLIVVGPSNRATAKQLFEAARIASGADNIYFEDVEVLEVPWLD